MFPIICLSNQLEAINYYILYHKLDKDMIYEWLVYYGELVKPGEKITRGWNSYFQGTPAPCHIYWSRFGFRNRFSFIESNQIEIHWSLGGYSFNKVRKWIEGSNDTAKVSS